MSPLRPEVLRHGSLVVRALDWVANLFKGKRLVECTGCEGSGVEFIAPDFPRSLKTVARACLRCHGCGEVWQ